MSILRDRFLTAHVAYHGKGYLAGEVPPDPNPDELDGRTKILNVPSRIRVVVLDRRSLFCVASTISGEDGTWRAENLSLTQQFMVLGINGAGNVNAAVQDCVTPVAMV